MKNIASTLLLMIITIAVYAQKLPNVQTGSLRAPATIKIDGKANEWDGKFQAYNKVTSLSYTIANDDNNLYLCVHAKEPRVIEKILCVGITLTINNTGQKNDKNKEGASITYPIIPDKYVQGILVNAGDKTYWSGLPAVNRASHKEVLTRTDSSVVLANKVFNANAQLIKIKGIKGISDTLISVYNEQSIKAAAIFGKDGAYTYELQVPLQNLGLSANDPKSFAYQIKLNNWGQPETTGYVIKDPITGERVSMDGDPDLNSTTDFWADYTLSKKP